MATTPQFHLRDGSGSTSNLVLTTNQERIVLSGSVNPQTIALQVSVNGAPFVSDPDLVSLDYTSFTIPNLDVHPDGLPLRPGENTIQIRAIDMVGGVSSTSAASITRVTSLTIADARIPTGIRMRRRRDAVDILVAKDTSDGFEGSKFLGYNFYASTSPAGSTGYFKVNEAPVLESSGIFEEDVLYEYEDTTNWEVGSTDSGPNNIRIRVTDEDVFGVEQKVRLDRTYPGESLYVGRLKFTGRLDNYRLQEFVRFRHFRAGGPGIINSDMFNDVADNEPLYYVVTGVYFDPTTNQEVETPYSQEVLGTPLVIDTLIRDLPGRSKIDVITNFVQAIQRVNQELTLIPGSTTRTATIDPFASEAERIWFLLDFVHRSQSFLTLLQIDDADGDGESDPVESSPYKTALKAALGLNSDQAVQNLIDQQFDKLAGDRQQGRRPARPAIGSVVFYSQQRPMKDVTIPAGTVVYSDADPVNNVPSLRFRVGGTYTLPVKDAEAYYNYITKRYEVRADIIAETVGSEGNRPAGSIKRVTGLSGFSVINTSSTIFGRDRESNAELAERSMLAFTSVDSGTEGGYQSTATSEVGVVKSKVVKSGDALMMRDFDPVRKKHIGGKVDIWVQGVKERDVTERFSFTYEVARNIQCEPLDLSTLKFRVMDSRVTLNSPIMEILHNPTLGFGMRNATTGQDFDISGVEILDFQTFKLNTNIPQPPVNIDDVIVADYRFRSSNLHFFKFQPVRRVVSVVGEVSGVLQPNTGYQLYKTDDPLLEGESVLAKNYLAIHQVNGVPSGETITVNDEQHVMIGFIEEPLLSIGINQMTIRVFSQDRAVEYDGPGSVDPDFEIIEGTPTTPVRIVRTPNSKIQNGQTVSVDYVHDENFTVTYVINDLLHELQKVVDVKKHTTADVLVKQAIHNQIDIETTVQLFNRASKDKVDPLLRTNVSQELDRKTISKGVAQSDIIQAIDATSGVDYAVVPFARMGYADGSVKLRERVASSFTLVPSLAMGNQRVFILNEPLRYPTTLGGGLPTEHRGVFQDDQALTLQDNPLLVGQKPYQATILGANGYAIPGYDGPTANRILISLPGSTTPLEDPSDHTYAVSYVVRGDKGPHDIQASQVEFIGLGSMTVTHKEAVDGSGD